MNRLLRSLFLLVLMPGICALAQEDSWITYRPAGGTEVYRISAHSSASPENISLLLNSLVSQAPDIWLNLSPNGEWMLLETERWGCDGWDCLARIKSDLTEAGLVLVSSQVVHAGGMGAISSDGDTIVWEGDGCGSHSRDLWVSQRNGGNWSASCLTGTSAANINQQPAISEDGQHILFLCGENICSIDIDGTHLQLRISPADYPGEGDWSQIQSPDFDPEGNIVFEGEADAERIWKQDQNTCDYHMINSIYTNDNSPCVLPDGRIASLWLNRPQNPSGVHELKIIDVFDIGLGCGGFSAKVFTDGFESGDESLWDNVTPAENSFSLGCWRRISPAD